MKKLFIFAISISVSGCFFNALEQKPLLYSDFIVTGLPLSKNGPCFPAKVELNEEFKYGCFCGKGHPSIPFPRDVPFSQLPLEEQKNLIQKYKSIRPVDDVDFLCQEHDICWLTKGDGNSGCNEHFTNELSWLYNDFTNVDRYNYDYSIGKVFSACAKLAADLITVSGTFLMESRDTGIMSQRGMITGTLVPMALLFTPVGLWNYPNPDYRCNAPLTRSLYRDRSVNSEHYQRWLLMQR